MVELLWEAVQGCTSYEVMVCRWILVHGVVQHPGSRILVQYESVQNIILLLRRY